MNEIDITEALRRVTELQAWAAKRTQEIGAKQTAETDPEKARIHNLYRTDAEHAESELEKIRKVLTGQW